MRGEGALFELGKSSSVGTGFEAFNLKGSGSEAKDGGCVRATARTPDVKRGECEMICERGECEK